MTPQFFGARGLALFLALLAPSGGAAQGRLQVGATRLEIGSDGTATSLVLRNTGSAPVAAQVRVYRWSQPDGVDRLEPTGEVVLSPAIVEVPAGSEQLVRVIRLGPPALERDDNYRVVVDEIPAPEGVDGVSVRVRMRYLLPLFVRAPAASPAALSCVVEAGGARLACENGGARAVQVGAPRLVGGDGQALALDTGMAGYFLPGTRKVWALSADPADRSGTPLWLETQLDGRPTILDVAREP